MNSFKNILKLMLYHLVTRIFFMQLLFKLLVRILIVDNIDILFITSELRGFIDN